MQQALQAGDIAQGLTRVGIGPGDVILVHSSLSSFGPIEGGAETVIDALLSVVGDTGTVMVPTFGSTDEVFDPSVSETGLGALPRAFWKRPNARRSHHPLASVAAIGRDAAALIDRHEEAETAHGEETPYHRLLDHDGKILLLGVDQDRSTFLHTAEELARMPYLRAIKRRYVDKAGRVIEGSWSFFPGPHRNFIGLQHKLEAEDLIRKTRIGSCVVQAMECRPLIHTLLRRLAEDPALFLSPNPSLPDGVDQRAKLFRNELAAERFTVAADTRFAGESIEQIIEHTRRYGIDRVVLSTVGGYPWRNLPKRKRAWYLTGLREAGIEVAAIRFAWSTAAEAVSLFEEATAGAVIVPSTLPRSTAHQIAESAPVLLENVRIPGREIVEMVERLGSESSSHQAPIRIAVQPIEFLRIGEHPFLDTFTKTALRRYIGALFFADGLATGQRVPPGEGLAELAELLSMLRARSFDGLVVLQAENTATFQKSADSFFRMRKELGLCPET